MTTRTRKRWGSRNGREGFVLPMAVFMLLVLTVLALSGFFLAQQEALMGTATRNAELAFYLAERGGVDVLADWDGDIYGALRMFGDTTVSDTLTEGRWTVTVKRLSGNLYLLESESFITFGGLLRQGATRRLGYIVRSLSPDIDPPSAALTVRGAIEIGGSASIFGGDSVPSALAGYCPGGSGAEAGILTNDQAAISNITTGTISGNPAIRETSSVDSTTFTTLGGLTWTQATALADDTIAGGSIYATPSLTSAGNCDNTDPNNWGSPTNPGGGCGGYFPVVYVNGNARMTTGSSGQGILLVEGDLALRGNFTFYGMIVVQGSITATGSNTIYGGLMVRNEDDESQYIRGTTLIYYSKCALTRALAYSTAGQAYPLSTRSWVDLSAAAN